MVDGRPVRSCLTFAATCEGADVRTIEGYDGDPLMASLRAAFSRHHALQCGYCTPGMLATAYDIVRRLPEADEARIREELSGNLCRCTGYAGIVAAIADVLAAPPAAAVQPIARPAPQRDTDRDSPTRERTPAPPEGRPAAPASPSVAIPERIEDGVTLERRLELSVAPDRVWTLFQDLPSVVRCLPGAALDAASEDPAEPVRGSFTVAIGPMRATFEGRALVSYDADHRAGRVRGAGSDPVSRSRAEGELRFRVADGSHSGASAVVVEMTYRLKGPLAQFGRPAIVADVVDRLMARFADNLSAFAEGGEAVHSEPVSGFGLLFGALVDRAKHLFARRQG
nr:2Fe-2S iron-sulfur cluster-binding protein [Aurantimonas sp. VKM B-3413]